MTQIGFLGHVLGGRGLERYCLLGMVEGRGARGRQRMKYMDGIRELNGCGRTEEVLRYTRDRLAWRSIATNIDLVTALR